jgi:hypothetical protein
MSSNAQNTCTTIVTFGLVIALGAAAWAEEKEPSYAEPNEFSAQIAKVPSASRKGSDPLTAARDKPAAKVAKGAGTPFMPHTEPDYQYEPLEFHDLRAATAEAENRDVIVFRRGDIFYRVETLGGKAGVRQKLATTAAEAIWNSQQAESRR